MATMTPKKDRQTVTSDSKPILDLLDGVIIRSTTTHVDPRGSLVELYNPAWGVNADAMTYAYAFTILPGKVKGWGVHHRRTDRIVQLTGRIKCVMYDDRPESPTYRRVSEFNTSDFDRHLIIIPPYVWHLHWNFGTEEALFISFPTEAYNHEDPDIYRLPPDNDYIPYHPDFDAQGW